MPENASQPNPHETLRRNPRRVKIGVIFVQECPELSLINASIQIPKFRRVVET
jgi:hypothetical protein